MARDRDLQGFAYEKITVSGTAVGGTVGTYAPTDHPRAKSALVTTETNSIRIKYHGGAATAAEGHLLAAGASFRVDGAASVAAISMIATGADAAVHITYER